MISKKARKADCGSARPHHGNLPPCEPPKLTVFTTVRYQRGRKLGQCWRDIGEVLDADGNDDPLGVEFGTGFRTQMETFAVT